LDDPAAMARAFTSDGYFRTGDLVESGGAGFVFKSRIGDSLRLGGFLVAPEEIEGFLQTLPGIAEAQVVGVEWNGDCIAVAFVRPSAGAILNEAPILEACRASLARYKQPIRAISIDAFPVTESPNGVKIQRTKLRDMARSIPKLVESCS
ncbi:MAG: acyl-CoA synthetase, partial [Rhodomicrobium sp.]